MANSVEKQIVDRRRSHRALVEGLTVQLGEVGPCRLLQVSLGGAVFETRRKLQPGARHVLHLDHAGERAVLETEIYRSHLQELLYDDRGNSRIIYRSRAVFVDPSVGALNVLYGILRKHWSPQRSG